jgi:transcriptional regulator with XRE-family HTH domain
MSKKNQRYNRLDIILAEKNISNKELAKGIKKDPASVSRWCTNETQPGVKMLYQIANFLDIDVRDLLVTNKTTGTRNN